MLVQIKFYELLPHMLFLHYYKCVLKHTCNIFTNFSHVIVTKFYVNEYYIHLKTCKGKFYVDYHIVCTNVLRYFKDGRKHYFLSYKN